MLETFSIIMPAYNHASMIGEAINSVLSELGPDDELIVINDGSVDATAATVRQFTDARIRLLSHDQNQGLSATRNTSLRNATRDYIGFCDSEISLELA